MTVQTIERKNLIDVLLKNPDLSLPWKKYIVLNVTTPDSLQGDEENEDV